MSYFSPSSTSVAPNFFLLLSHSHECVQFSFPLDWRPTLFRHMETRESGKLSHYISFFVESLDCSPIVEGSEHYDLILNNHTLCCFEVLESFLISQHPPPLPSFHFQTFDGIQLATRAVHSSETEDSFGLESAAGGRRSGLVERRKRLPLIQDDLVALTFSEGL